MSLCLEDGAFRGAVAPPEAIVLILTHIYVLPPRVEPLFICIPPKLQ